MGVTLPTTASTDVTSAQRQKAGRTLIAEMPFGRLGFTCTQEALGSEGLIRGGRVGEISVPLTTEVQITPQTGRIALFHPF